MGHTEELAKQNTFNNLDPYDDDDTAVFLLEVTLKDKVTRAAHNKNGSLHQQVTTLTVHYSLEGPSKLGNPLLANNLKDPELALGHPFITTD